MSDVVARGSKLQAHYHDKLVHPNCICIACNSMKFVRAAAVLLKVKKKKVCDLKHSQRAEQH